MKPSKRSYAPALAAVAALAGLAPSAGNIGSCGQAAEPLDAQKFVEAKQAVDCSHCIACGIETGVCERACTDEADIEASFPPGCLPLVHDGEVCLDALSASSCSRYETFVADEGATLPTECDFCPVDEAGEPNRDEDE